jgi:hypothetical protein
VGVVRTTTFEDVLGEGENDLFVFLKKLKKRKQ